MRVQAHRGRQLARKCQGFGGGRHRGVGLKWLQTPGPVGPLPSAMPRIPVGPAEGPHRAPGPDAT